MLENLRRDAQRYRDSGGWYRCLGFWVVATYRFGRWARSLPPGLRLPFQFLYGLASIPWRLALHVEIPTRASIGPGLALPHPYNVIVPGGAVVGADCTLYHEVTMGMGPRPGLPRIGDRVVLFVGARVLGGITLGDAVEIGANAVVFRDVPAGSLVMSAASRALPRSLARPPGSAPPGGAEDQAG